MDKDAGESGGFVTRYFRPTSLAGANRISIAVLVAIIAALGIISYRTVPKEASPEITIPMISVPSLMSRFPLAVSAPTMNATQRTSPATTRNPPVTRALTTPYLPARSTKTG